MCIPPVGTPDERIMAESCVSHVLVMCLSCVCSLCPTDDVLKLHFMKHTKVVVIETAERVLLSVPVSSYLKFSILYDPNNSTKEAMQGFR